MSVSNFSLSAAILTKAHVVLFMLCEVAQLNYSSLLWTSCGIPWRARAFKANFSRTVKAELRMRIEKPGGPLTVLAMRHVINSFLCGCCCLSGIPVAQHTFIILPLVTTCYQSQRLLPTLRYLNMDCSSSPSTMSYCLGYAWGNQES